jgi:hypothetical protein
MAVLYGGLELECPSGEYKIQKGNVKKYKAFPTLDPHLLKLCESLKPLQEITRRYRQ